jgi:hypothetical protein
MNIYRISTSAWDEEDFYLMTSLTDEKIKRVIQPMVDYERENDIMYTNDDYLGALKDKYPRSVIEFHQYFELIQF